MISKREPIDRRSIKSNADLGTSPKRSGSAASGRKATETRARGKQPR